MSDNRVIDAYLGAHHDASLLEGAVVAQIEQEVAAELAADGAPEASGAVMQEDDR